MHNRVGRVKVIHHGDVVYLGGMIAIDPKALGLQANSGKQGQSHGGVKLYDIVMDQGKLLLDSREGLSPENALVEALSFRFAGEPATHAVIGNTLPHHLFEDRGSWLSRMDYIWTPRGKSFYRPSEVVLEDRWKDYYKTPIGFIQVPDTEDSVYHNQLSLCAVPACVRHNGAPEQIGVVPLYDWGLCDEPVADSDEETPEIIKQYPQVYYYQGPDNCSYVLRVDPTRFDADKLLNLGHLVGVDTYNGTSGLMYFNS